MGLTKGVLTLSNVADELTQLAHDLVAVADHITEQVARQADGGERK